MKKMKKNLCRFTKWTRQQFKSQDNPIDVYKDIPFLVNMFESFRLVQQRVGVWVFSPFLKECDLLDDLEDDMSENVRWTERNNLLPFLNANMERIHKSRIKFKRLEVEKFRQRLLGGGWTQTDTDHVVNYRLVL
jgi:hypothetical protein